MRGNCEDAYNTSSKKLDELMKRVKSDAQRVNCKSKSKGNDDDDERYECYYISLPD